jgi:hypothetical protein
MSKASKYDWGSDVRRIYSDLQADKRAKLEHRLATYMLEPTDLTMVVRRIMEVGERLQARRKKENYQACDSVWACLSTMLFDNNRLDIILACLSYFYFGSEEKSASTPTDLYVEAQTRILLELVRSTGLNIERSMKFALVLLEHYALCVEQSYVEPQKIVGRGNTGIAAYIIIMTSAASPFHEHFPTRDWFSNILVAQQTSEAEKEVWISLVTVITNGGRKLPVIKTYIPELLDNRPDIVAEIEESIQAITYDPAVLEHPAIAVVRDEKRIFNKWLAENDKVNSAKIEQKLHIIEWYRRNKDRLLEDQAVKMEAISKHPRRGLRPKGLDHIEVHVAPLQQAGIRSVIFYPKGKFPHVHLELVVKLLTTHLCRVPAELEDFKLQINPNILGKDIFCEEADLRGLLEYVIIHVLYQIIAQPTPARTKRKLTSGGRAANSEDEKRSSLIRAHLRTLRDGFEPSETATEESKSQFGWDELPPGFTFVRCHFRGGALEFDLSTPPPVAIYNDEVLLSVLQD